MLFSALGFAGLLAGCENTPIAARKKDAVLNIRVNSHDLASIKSKAQRLGVRYRALMPELIHRIAQAN